MKSLTSIIFNLKEIAIIIIITQVKNVLTHYCHVPFQGGEGDRGRFRVVDQTALQPGHAASLDELDKVVLRDAGRHIPAAVDREVGAPRHREVEADEGGLLVSEFRVPKAERRDLRRVRFAEFTHLQDGQLLAGGRGAARPRRAAAAATHTCHRASRPQPSHRRCTCWH